MSSGGRKKARRVRSGKAGATTSITGVQDRLDSYFSHHYRSATDSLRRLRASPVPTLLTVLVIAIALAFPSGLLVALKNLQILTRDWDGNAQISLYLQADLSEQEQVALDRQLQDMEEVQRTEMITAEQAFEEFRILSGYGDVIQGMDENPLPAVLIVFPKSQHYDSALAIKEQLADLPEVEIAQLDIEWVKRLHGFIAFGQKLLLTLVWVLALAVLLIVINTIRLHIENRRDEIVIIKLVGATDAFVRRPFLYTGLFYGLAGAFVAIILVQFTVFWLGGSVDYLVSLYESNFDLKGLSIAYAFNLLFLGAVLGWLGAWIAVSNHLLQVEPT